MRKSKRYSHSLLGNVSYCSMYHTPRKYLQLIEQCVATSDIVTYWNVNIVYPPILFNNKSFQQVSSQKHEGLILDATLTFDEYIKAITSEVCKAIGLLRILNICLPRSSLTTLYKSFGRPNLDYGDVIFDKAYSNSFQQRLESIQ